MLFGQRNGLEAHLGHLEEVLLRGANGLDREDVILNVLVDLRNTLLDHDPMA